MKPGPRVRLRAVDAAILFTLVGVCLVGEGSFHFVASAAIGALIAAAILLRLMATLRVRRTSGNGHSCRTTCCPPTP